MQFIDRWLLIDASRPPRQTEYRAAAGRRTWRQRRSRRFVRPLLVIAGAGSGKTNTLAHRVANLIVNGVDPRRILLMTFSRRAASEMSRRVESICSEALGAKAGIMTDALTWAGTFHAIGAKLLREYAEQIGLQPNFTIHDREESADLMNLLRHQLGFSQTESRFPTKGTCLSIYSRAVNAEMPLEAVLQGHFPLVRRLGGAAAGAVRSLCGGQAGPVRPRLRRPAAVLGADHQRPALAAHIGERFDHVLVDEYQDTNRLQSSILLALKPGGEGLTVVGDDAQSIYAFRAATVRNILDFPNQFSPPAAIITLDRNYRSTQPILAAANGVIGLAAERFTKNLWTERQSAELPGLVSVRDEADQARYVVERVLENREGGAELKQQAVLFRTSSHSGPLEIELTRRNIPFVKFGGLKFLDTAHVKDLLALLRFVENPRDQVAGFRILQLLPGIGPTSAQRVLDAMANQVDPIGAMSDLAAPPRAGEAWTDLVTTLLQLRSGKAGWPAESPEPPSRTRPTLNACTRRRGHDTGQGHAAPDHHRTASSRMGSRRSATGISTPRARGSYLETF